MNPKQETESGSDQEDMLPQLYLNTVRVLYKASDELDQYSDSLLAAVLAEKKQFDSLASRLDELSERTVDILVPIGIDQCILSKDDELLRIRNEFNAWASTINEKVHDRSININQLAAEISRKIFIKFDEDINYVEKRIDKIQEGIRYFTEHLTERLSLAEQRRKALLDMTFDGTKIQRALVDIEDAKKAIKEAHTNGSLTLELLWRTYTNHTDLTKIILNGEKELDEAEKLIALAQKRAAQKMAAERKARHARNILILKVALGLVLVFVVGVVCAKCEAIILGARITNSAIADGYTFDGDDDAITGQTTTNANKAGGAAKAAGNSKEPDYRLARGDSAEPARLLGVKRLSKEEEWNARAEEELKKARAVLAKERVATGGVANPQTAFEAQVAGEVSLVDDHINYVILKATGKINPDSELLIYRGENVVGVVKVSQPSRDNFVSADIIEGKIKIGDIARYAAAEKEAKTR